MPNFPFPFLDELTIPIDAGPNDPRVVLTSDVNGGVIRVYNNAGKLVGEWDAISFDVGSDLSTTQSRAVLIPGATVTQLVLDPPDSGSLGAMTAGQIFADLLSADDTPYIGIVSPKITAGAETQSRIDLYGSNSGGTFTAPHINIAPNAGGGANGYVDIPQDTNKTADFRIDNRSVGRGKIARQKLTTNSSGFTGDGATDMFINNVPVIAGRLYEIHLHSKYLLSASGSWSVGCHINGTRIGEFDFANEAAGTTKMFDGTVQWEPSSTQATDDITVELDEFAGASTLTLQASADSPRTLTLKDIGTVA